MLHNNEYIKKGILIVSFGTTYLETRKKNIEALADTVQNKFLDCKIWQAYSSDMVRSIILKREGLMILSIQEAFQQMKEAGIQEVTVLPTHIIDGVENNKMKQIAQTFVNSFQNIRIAGALLEKEEDYALVAQALWDSLKEKVGNRTLILMGHGTYHEADKSYEKLQKALMACSGQNIFIATVEGAITIEDIIQEMGQLETPSTQIVITPFMLVAGDHATNDMAGEEDSMYSKLKEHGYEVEYILKGIGEYEKIRNIYIQHLEGAK